MIPDQQIEALRESLAARAEQVCAHLLRGGKRRGNKWICGGVDGGAGKSMDVELEGAKAGVWLDRATNECGDLIQLWQLNQGVGFKDAVKACADFVGVHLDEDAPPSAARTQRINPREYVMQEPPAEKAAGGPPPAAKGSPPWTGPAVDWNACVAAMTDSKMAELATWRGYSPQMVDWMVANDLVGIYNGSFAFPVHDRKGAVVRVHYRLPKKGWAYYPSGGETAPLVVGNPQHASYTLACESQWDAFALLDKLEAHDPNNIGIYAAIITRGATSNTDFSKVECQELIACPQNDPESKRNEKTGRTPAEEWLQNIQETRNRKIPYAVFETPEGHDDANDWIRDAKPDHVSVFRAVVENSRNPILKNIRTVSQLLAHKVDDDPNAMIGYKRRFLSKGGSFLLIGPSGIGKSTLITDIGIHASAGIEWHGIEFRRPMRTLVIQAENDEGDVAEMLRGRLGHKTTRAHFTDAQFKDIGRNLMFRQVVDKTGQNFCKWLEEIIVESKAELVILDPLLSYVGDDISLQKVASQFLRDWLQPILQRTGAILMAAHHTGKPPSDSKSRSHWSDSDFSYLGLGSSELVNWARAVGVIMGTKDPKVFQLRLTKRGERAGMVNQFTQQSYVKDIFLRHGDKEKGEGLVWLQTEKPEEDEEEEYRGRGRKKRELPPLSRFLPILRSCQTYNDLLKAIRNEADLTMEEGKRMLSELILGGYVRKELDGLLHKVENR